MGAKMVSITEKPHVAPVRNGFDSHRLPYDYETLKILSEDIIQIEIRNENIVVTFNNYGWPPDTLPVEYRLGYEVDKLSLSNNEKTWEIIEELNA